MLKSCNLFQAVTKENELSTGTAHTDFGITCQQKETDEKESTEKDSDEPTQGKDGGLKVCLI
jgi:hypothetical protein